MSELLTAGAVVRVGAAAGETGVVAGDQLAEPERVHHVPAVTSTPVVLEVHEVAYLACKTSSRGIVEASSAGEVASLAESVSIHEESVVTDAAPVREPGVVSAASAGVLV